MWVAIAACLATGGLAGAVNGQLVAKAKRSPIGHAPARPVLARPGGNQPSALYSRFGDSFGQLAHGDWLDVPIPGYLFLLAIATGVFLSKTPTGRFIYAIGHNETAARFSGVAVDRIKFRLYTASGLLVGLATLIYLSRFDTAKADAGTGLESDVITAVVIGGTSIFGGRGNIGGTVLGLLLVHETKLFVGRYWRIEELKSILIGSLLIVSILAYRTLAPRDRD